MSVTDAIDYEFQPTTLTYTQEDLILYALAIGAAADPLDQSELRFVYELRSDFAALPTFAVTFPFSLIWQLSEAPGLQFNPALLLHGEQFLRAERPLPLSATVTNKARIANIYDKGSGALVLLEVNSYDDAGESIASNLVSLFIRGIGGFGGERGPSGALNVPPDRPPDAIHRQQTQPNQALLYRLTGDRNPLHADPAFAAAGGFDRPILHGLCTFGFAARAVLKQFANNDPSRFKSIQTRFTRHVFPGETIVTEMWATKAWATKAWADSPERVVFQCKTAERGEIVLANAVMELHPA